MLNSLKIEFRTLERQSLELKEERVRVGVVLEGVVT